MSGDASVLLEEEQVIEVRVNEGLEQADDIFSDICPGDDEATAEIPRKLVEAAAQATPTAEEPSSVVVTEDDHEGSGAEAEEEPPSEDDVDLTGNAEEVATSTTEKPLSPEERLAQVKRQELVVQYHERELRSLKRDTKDAKDRLEEELAKLRKLAQEIGDIPAAAKAVVTKAAEEEKTVACVGLGQGDVTVDARPISELDIGAEIMKKLENSGLKTVDQLDDYHICNNQHGIPGATYDSSSSDPIFFSKFEIDQIGVARGKLQARGTFDREIVIDHDKEATTQKTDPDAWRRAPISELSGLTPSIVKTLAENNIETIGQLEDCRAKWGGLASIKGFGEAKVTLIEDSIIAWLSKNRDAKVLAQAEAAKS